jgi:hypothetical protein
MFLHDIVNPLTVAEAWSAKYKRSINCSHPRGFSQKAHCAGKKKHNESVEMEMTCPDCGMCQTHGTLNEIRKGQKDANGFTKCWPGKHAAGTKKGKNGGQVRNCVPNESIAESEVDEVFGFQTTRPAVKKPTATLAQMRKEFEKQAPAPQPRVVQNKDADEVRAREVHVRHADEAAKNSHGHTRKQQAAIAMAKQGVAEGEGGLGQTAGIGINGKQFNFSIKDLIAKAQNYPVKKLNPQLFVKQLADRHEDPKQTAARAQAADLQYPIIVVQDGNTLMIADGTHRAQKAIMNKLPSINAHVIPVKDMAEFSKQGVAEGITPNVIHKLADLKGIKWDNEPSFLKLTKRLTGKAHLDELNQDELKKVKHYLEKQGVAENDVAAGIDKFFNNLGDPVISNLQRVALLAMQGRQSEAAGQLRFVIKDADLAVQKKITDAVNNIKPVTINGKVADSSTLDKSKKHQEWILQTFIPWVQSQLPEQGVAEGRLNEFAPGAGDDGEEETLHKYARMWYNGDDATQQKIEKILDRMGWEIGEIESEEGGCFVVQAGDEHGRSYIGFAPEDLTEDDWTQGGDSTTFGDGSGNAWTGGQSGNGGPMTDLMGETTGRPYIRKVEHERADGSIETTYELLDSNGRTIKTGMSKETAMSVLKRYRADHVRESVEQQRLAAMRRAGYFD